MFVMVKTNFFLHATNSVNGITAYHIRSFLRVFRNVKKIWSSILFWRLTPTTSKAYFQKIHRKIGCKITLSRRKNVISGINKELYIYHSFESDNEKQYKWSKLGRIFCFWASGDRKSENSLISISKCSKLVKLQCCLGTNWGLSLLVRLKSN